MPTLLLIRDRELSQAEHVLLPDHWQVIDGALPVVGRLDLRAPMRLVVEQAVKVARLVVDAEIAFHQQIPARVGQIRELEDSSKVDRNQAEPSANLPAAVRAPSWWQLLELGNIEGARAQISETSFSPPDATAVRRLLSVNDEAQLVFVIEVIASQQWSQFVLTLRSTLRHPSAAVRIASLLALRQMSAVRMLPYVELLLEDPNPDVAAIAAQVIRGWE